MLTRRDIIIKWSSYALASLLLSFESVFGVLFSVLLLGERLTLRMGVGCVLIFTAVVLAQVLPELAKEREKQTAA